MDTENNGNYTVSRAIKLLRQFRFEDASYVACRVLEDNPDDERAQCVLMLAGFEVPDIDALYDMKGVLESEHFKKALSRARGEFVDMLGVFREKYLEKCEKRWHEAEASFAAGNYEIAQLDYLFLGSYKNSDERWRACQEKMGDKAMQRKAYSLALEYYEDSKNARKIAEAKRPLDAIEDFKKEIGNPNTYLKRMLYTKHPQIWREYERLCANPKRSLFESRESKSYKTKKINAANKANNYCTVTVMPKIREIREELKAKYADRIDQEKLEKLMKELHFRF